jgi:formamidopyrimidine-DNA glycosylase
MEIIAMPELPDVEFFKEYFESTALRKIIIDVTVQSSQILDGITANALTTILKGQEFLSCKRYGKYLFSQANADLWLVLHFGMTGNLKYFKAASDEPRYSRLLISFTNGHCLAFSDQRKLGRVAISNSITEFVSRRQLGPDALQIGFSTFRAIIAKRDGTAKSTLMNQHIIAGIGNIYADEILFQAGIHPQGKIGQLNDHSVEELFDAMKRVLSTAISNLVDLSALPQSYLIHYRFKGARCPLDGGEIASTKVAGRTTYFCPVHQKIRSLKAQIMV